MDTDSIVSFLVEQYKGLQAIYLFGSYGTDAEFPDSDIDIAVLLDENAAAAVTGNQLLEAGVSLGRITRKPVDLVNLRNASTVMQKEVIASDKCIYCTSLSAVLKFEMETISDYQHLNYERRFIIEDFLETGRAYQV